MHSLIGEFAALSAAMLWTFASVLFTTVGKRIGPFNLNAIRMAIGSLLLLVTHYFLSGSFFPSVSNIQFFYLAVSGIIGLAMGDFTYFGALIAIGPRKTTLIYSMAPIFSLIGGYFILMEMPSLLSLLGVFLVLIGVWVVIIEREGEEEEKRNKIKGVLLGITAAASQGIGVVISKYGMLKIGNPVEPISATLIRIVVATAVIWIALLLWKKPQDIIRTFQDTYAMKLTILASFIGPFLGLWFSMISINYAQVGIASTLMSLTPVMIIPVMYFLYGEKTNARGILGVIIAVVGVAMIFLF